MADSVEALLREILAGQAVLETKVTAVEAQSAKAADTAGKALEVSNRISTILEEQDIGARFAEHKRDVRDQIAEIRQDFVHANTEVRKHSVDSEAKWMKEIEALGARVKALEEDRQRRDGAKNLLTWASEKAPWLLALAGGAAALLGFKDKLP